MSQQSQVDFFDGQDNRRRAVTVHVRDTLIIEAGDTVLARWPLADVRLMPSADGMARYRLAELASLARLEVTDEWLMAAIRRACPNLGRGNGAVASRRQTLRILGGALAAAASVLALVLYGLPLIADRLAPHIPPLIQHEIGEVSAKQLHERLKAPTCTDPHGQAVLDKLMVSLARAGHLTQPLRTRAIRTKLANALALPGGRVFVFSGLLDAAQTPDELAGVLAHELGHEAHYDSMRRLVESSGTGLLLGMILGDFTGSTSIAAAASSLINASYSRAAEQRADDFAIAVMTRLGRSPKPFGTLLARITKGQDIPAAMSLLADHPLTADRLANLTAHDTPTTAPPLLSTQDWLTLRGICGG
ncbi:MAG: M48 family metallopeptidase [Hyphomicrobiales bacterium]|nr:M48 family metallopeptidase [Hyphomicrobiales bacterium]MDE2114706.1 M48 family metallopeptidase [Hyphomicrobiales bacterium]